MSKQPSQWLAGSVLLLALSGCGGDVSIQAPADDSVHPDSPAEYRISFADGAPALLTLTLNGMDVSDQFVVNDTGASANGDDLASAMQLGLNTFEVNADGVSQRITFILDQVGPKIHIVDVIETESERQVSGYLDDAGGAVSLSVDGVNIDLNGNQFQFSTGQEEFVELQAEDVYGHQSEQIYARRDLSFGPSISTRITQQGLAFMVEQLRGAVEGEDIDDTITEQNPFLFIDVPAIMTMSFAASGLDYDNPDVQIDISDDETFTVSADMDNMIVYTEVTFGPPDWLWWIPSSTSGATITASRVSFDSSAQLQINSGDVDLGLSGTDVSLDGLHIDIDWTPDWLPWGFDELFSSTVSWLSDFFIGFFIDAIEDLAVPVMSEFIEDIPVHITLSDLAGATIEGTMSPYQLDTFNGGISIDMSGNLMAPNVAAEPGPSLGSLYQPGDLPSVALADTTPAGDAYDIGAVIGSNFLNQAFLAAHESGFTTLTLGIDDNQGISWDGVKIFANPEDELQSQDQMRLRIEPESAPFLILSDDPAEMGRFGLYDLTFGFDVYRDNFGDFENIVEAKVNIEAVFTLGATDNGNLMIGIEQLPEITVLDSQNIGPINLSPAFINNLLDYYLPLIMPQIAEGLSSVPLPTIAGFGIRPQDFWVTGDGNNFLAMAGDMVKVEDIANAEAPDTIIALNSPSALDSLAASFSGSLEASSADINPAGLSDVELSVTNGSVTLAVTGDNPTSEPLEYRYRVDGGRWSVWAERDEIVLRRLLGGSHTVEVCARTQLLKQDLSCPQVDFVTGTTSL